MLSNDLLAVASTVVDAFWHPILLSKATPRFAHFQLCECCLGHVLGATEEHRGTAHAARLSMLCCHISTGNLKSCAYETATTQLQAPSCRTRNNEFDSNTCLLKLSLACLS